MLNLGLAAALAVVTTASPPIPHRAQPIRLVDPPVGVVAVAGVSSIRVSWQGPPMDLGAARYVAYAEPGGATCDTLDWRTFGCLLGVRAGVSYRVSVRTNGESVPAYAPARVVATAPRPPHDVPPDALDLRVARHRERVEVRGDGFLPHSAVALAVYRRDGTGPRTLALPTADAEGRLSSAVRPATDGAHTLLAQGLDPAGAPRVLAALVPPNDGGRPNTGGLPSTGGRFVLPAATGVALIVLGVAAMALGRRRRDDTQA